MTSLLCFTLLRLHAVKGMAVTQIPRQMNPIQLKLSAPTDEHVLSIQTTHPAKRHIYIGSRRNTCYAPCLAVAIPTGSEGRRCAMTTNNGSDQPRSFTMLTGMQHRTFTILHDKT
jgi:hypothetical protein